MRIEAKKSPTNPKKVVIQPSGLELGDETNVNVKLKLSGFNEQNLTFQATGGELTDTPPINTDVSSVSGFVNSTRVIRVTTEGTFTATSDNSKINLQLDQSQRTITITVSEENQSSAQNGNITINIEGCQPKVIPVTLAALDAIVITLTPEGPNFYINQKVKCVVTGTTKTITPSVSDSKASITPTPDTPYSWDVVSREPITGLTITFTGEGVKTNTKSLSYIPLKNLTATPSSVVGIAGHPSTVTITGGDNIRATSDNEHIHGSVSQNVITLTADTPQTGNITVTADNANNLVVPVNFKAETLTIGFKDIVNNVPYDYETEFEILNGVEGMTVKTSVPEFKPRIVKEGNKYKLKVVSTGVKTGDVVVSGPDRNPGTKSVVFTDKDTLSITLSPQRDLYYLDDVVVATITGTNRELNVLTSTDDLVVTPVHGETHKYHISVVEEVVDGAVTFLGKGVKTLRKELTFNKVRHSLSAVIPEPYNSGIYPGDVVPITFLKSSSITGFNVVSSSEHNTIAHGEGDVWNFTCTQPGVVTLRATGEHVDETIVELNVEALIDLTTDRDSYESNKDEVIDVAISNARRGDIIIAPSDEKITYLLKGRNLELRASEAVTGNVVIKGRGYNNKTINVVFDNRAASGLARFQSEVINSKGEEKLDSYIGNSYELNVLNSPNDVRFSCSEPRIKVRSVSFSNPEEGIKQTKFYLTTEHPDGLTSITTTGTLSADGYKSKVIPIEFNSVEVPVIQNIKNKVPYDHEIVLAVTGITKKPIISTTDIDLQTSVSKEDDRYLIKVKSLNGAIKAKIVVDGKGIKTTYHDIEFLPLNEFNIKIDSTSLYGKIYTGDTVTITVKGRDGVTGETIEVVDLKSDITKSDGVVLSTDPLKPNVFVFSSNAIGSALMKLSAPGYKPKTLEKITWLGGAVMTAIDVEGLGIRYLNETISIKIENAPSDITVNLNDNADIILTEVRKDFYLLKATKPTKGFITFSGKGYNSEKFNFEFKNEAELDLTSKSGTVARGEEFEIIIPKQPVNYIVATLPSFVSYRKVSNPDESTSFYLSSKEISTFEFSVVGRGLKVKPAKVSFRPEDIASIVVDTSTYIGGMSYTNEEVIFTVVGTEKTFTVYATSDLDDHNLLPLGNKRYKLTKPTSGTVTINVVGKGIKGREIKFNFLDIITPKLGYNLDYDKFFVNEKPLLFVSDNVVVPFTIRTDNGSGDASVITCKPFKNNQRCFEVSTKAPCNGTITISGRGIKETSIKCIFEALKQPSVTFVPTDKRGYVTKGILLESTDNITVTLVEGDEVVIKELK